jgi:hypothetical protein
MIILESMRIQPPVVRRHDVVFCGMQIQVYFPGKGHPASGVVRTFVRDNTDTNTGAASQVRCYLSLVWRRDRRGDFEAGCYRWANCSGEEVKHEMQPGELRQLAMTGTWPSTSTRRMGKLDVIHVHVPDTSIPMLLPCLCAGVCRVSGTCYV